MRVADPKACQCGEVLKGVIKPWECKVFGTACTPEHAIGTCMVSPGGRLRRLLQLRSLRARAGGGLGGAGPEQARRRAGSDREQRILEIIETTRAKRPRFKSEQVTMAHGAGGKASQSLIEGLLVPAFDPAGDGLAELADAGTVPLPSGEELLVTTDSYVVRPLRFPGGSIGELAVNGTVNDLAVAGARPLAITVGADPRGGARRRACSRPRSRRSPRRPRRPGSRSSPATPRSSSAARPTACT